MPLRDLTLLAFFVASVPVCFFRPFYGIALWVVVAFLNPQSFTWASFWVFPWATAVALPTLLGVLVFERRLGRLVSREVGLMVILWIWFTITTVVSVNLPEFAHHAVETHERWSFVSKVLLMTLCTVVVVNSFERLRYLVMTIAACFGFYVLKSAPFIIATGGVHRLYGPDRSMVADNTALGLALNMTLPLYYYLAQTETKRWLKNLLWFLFFITIPAIFFTYSRGAVLGLAAVFLVMLLQSRRRLTLVPVVVAGLVIATAFAPEKWRDRMDPSRQEGIDLSGQARLDAWQYARALAAEYPITGGGFETYTEELYARYWPGRIGPIYGPHSVYFRVLAEHGYVGLGLYMLLVLSCFATAHGLRKRARSRGDSEVGQYAHMFQLSLVGFLVSGIFLGHSYFDYYFTIVACITILNQVARERWAAAPEPVPASVTVSLGPGAPPRREFGLPAAQLSGSGRK
jgi:putative inorganic carbon (hco3(-)) transporter